MTLFDVFLKVTNQYKNEVAFIHKVNGAEKKVTYKQLFDDVLLLSNAFAKKEIKKGDKVMFVSDNRYEWIMTDLALLSLGAISVPRGTDTPTQELEYIMTHAECTYLIVENQETFDLHKKLLNTLNLSSVFIMDEYDKLINKNLTITQEETNSFIKLHTLHKPEDMFTIIYTSGTTGKPKGVVLNHINMLYNLKVVPEIINLTHEDMWLSILPPWHVFERGVEYVSLSKGCTMVYSSVKTFAIDLEYYKPTLVATVPRLWESLYSKINLSINKDAKKAVIFNLLVKISRAYNYNQRLLRDELPKFEKDGFVTNICKKSLPLLKVISLYPVNYLAKKKLSLVQNKFGGRLRLAISGGGALAEYVDDWIDALGIKIINSYGMTECSPSIAGRDYRSNSFGTVGPALSGTQLKIVDEHENEVKTGVEGHVLVKGPQVMRGYYKSDEENKKSFTKDGFLKTGDLGKLTISSELILTGRSKEIIVLSNGENIDPSRIESAISILPFISDSMLVGQDKKGLGLLIVADMEILKEYIQTKLNKAIESAEHVMQDKQIINNIKSEINEILHKKHGFKPFEKLQNIHFLDHEFKPGEELTNTLKKKRHIIEQKYQGLINNFLK